MSEQKKAPETITIGAQMECIIDAATTGQNGDEATSYYGGLCVGESIPPWVIGRVVETYNAFAGIENPAAFMEAVADAKYLLYKSQPVSCPSWIDGIGDCDKPECRFCRAKKCLEQLEAAKGAKI